MIEENPIFHQVTSNLLFYHFFVCTELHADVIHFLKAFTMQTAYVCFK